MVKIKESIRRISEKVTLNQAIFIFSVTGILGPFLLIAAIKISYWMLLLEIPIIVIFIVSCAICMIKSVENVYMRYQKQALELIKEYLESEYKRIIFVNDIRDEVIVKKKIKDTSNCFAKLMKNDEIVIIIKDDNGIMTNIFQTTDYLWFIKNFHVL